MTRPNGGKGHWSFWLIAVFALVWNAMGCLNFVMQMGAGDMASLPESHIALIEARPVWATAGFAVSVFGGMLAGFLLVMRRAKATPVFWISLAGTLVVMVHAMGYLAGFSGSEIGLMIVAPIAVAVFMVWYARRAQRVGWLR